MDLRVGERHARCESREEKACGGIVIFLYLALVEDRESNASSIICAINSVGSALGAGMAIGHSTLLRGGTRESKIMHQCLMFNISSTS